MHRVAARHLAAIGYLICTLLGGGLFGAIGIFFIARMLGQ